ncbi:MAG: GGDEF domain-containing protein [Defluviitaleaceae bacterium]|nr:GGDEF domain-containing protein [Defluviitaleaceae bacterium]
MDKFIYSFLDEMPIFLCVANADTEEPIYFNKLAQTCFNDKPEEEKATFVKDVLRSNNFIFRDKDGNDGKGRWFKMEKSSGEWPDGKNCITIVGMDHSQYISNEEILSVPAFTDDLTGIFNRNIGLERLTKLINELEGAMPSFAMCFLDLDDLKFVNERYGHTAGDQYILTVVDLIKKSIRKTDIFARMGSDEFLVIFPKCTVSVATAILQEVTKMLDAVNGSNQPRTYYSISYGVLEIGPEDCKDIEALLSEAGSVMQKMKKDYKKTRMLP